MPLSENQKRLIMQNTMTGLEDTERGAAVATFPEINPNTAPFQIPQYVAAPKVAPAEQGHRVANREISRTGLTSRLMQDGMDVLSASLLVDDVFKDMPDTRATIDYDRLDAVMTRARYDIASGAADNADKLQRILKDMNYAGTTLWAAFGGLQQGAFGVLSGENPAVAWDRVFPDADVRMPDNTVERQRMGMLAAKGIASGTVGLLLEIATFGKYGSGEEGNKFLRDARVTAEQLVNTEWHDNLITGNELLEYMEVYAMEHEGKFWGPRIPATGTPERELYDQNVRETMDEVYAELQDNRDGNLSLGARAVFGAAADVFVDPVLWVSGMAKLGIAGGRKLTGAATRARTTTAVAERGRRLTDIAEAVKNSEEWLAKSGKLVDSRPGDGNALKQLQHAEKMVSRNKALFEAGNDAAASAEQIMFSVHPRIATKNLEDLGNVYLSSLEEVDEGAAGLSRQFLDMQLEDTAAKIEGLTEQVKKVGADVTVFEGEKAVYEGTQDLLFHPEDLGDDLPALERSLQGAKEDLKAWEQTSEWFDARMENEKGSRTDAFFRDQINKQQPYEPGVLLQDFDTKNAALRGVQNNIDRGLAQDAPMGQIAQWEATYTDILMDRIDWSSAVPRNTALTEDIIASALLEQRIKASQADPTPIGNFLDTSNPASTQRIAFGPDQTERASEVARGLASGLALEDIAFHGTGVEMYNVSYNSIPRPHSGTEMRAAEVVSKKALASDIEWLGRDPVETKIEAAEWQRSVGEKFGDFFGKGLYPDSYFPRAPVAIQYIREEMRLLQSMNPRLYTRMVDAFHGEEFEITRAMEFYRKELDILGVFEDVGGVRVPNPEKKQRFFDILDMDPTGDDFIDAMNGLTEAERRSMRRIREEADFFLNKLGVAGTDRHISGFIHHTFDPRWLEKGNTLISELQGIPVDAEIFTPALQLREGKKGYTRDLALALDLYTRSAARKLYVEPLIEDLMFEAERHVKLHPGDKWYAQLIDTMVRNLKGQPTTLGRWVDNTVAAHNVKVRAQAKLQVPQKVGPVPTGPLAGKSANDVARLGGKGLEKIVGPALTRLGEGAAKAGEALQVPGENVVSEFMSRPGSTLAKIGGHATSEGVRISEFGSTMSSKGVPLYVRGDISRTALAITSAAYASTLGGSSRYFPMAISTAFATTGSRKGMFGTLEGVLTMASEEGRANAKLAGLDKQFIRVMEDAMYSKLGGLAANMPSYNGVTVVGPSISATENVIRGWTYHATIGELFKSYGFRNWEDAVKAGKANAIMHEAVRTTEEANHLFGSRGKPPVFSRMSKSLSAGATQFLSFIPKQSEELLAQTRNNPGKIIQYMMISGYLNRVMAKVGIDISDYVGMGFIPHSPDEARSIASETMLAFMSWTDETAKMAAGVGDKDATAKAGDNFLRSLTNFLPLALAVQRNAHRNEQLRIGRVMSGQKAVRDLDLGDFNWNSELSDTENLKLLFTEGLGDPGRPTELMSILTGMTSTAAKLERQQYQQSIRSMQDRLHRKRAIVRAFVDARDRGDTTALSVQLNRAINEGMLPPNIERIIDRITLEKVVPRLMRLQNKSDQQMLDTILESLEAEAMYDIKFNRSTE